MFLINQKQVKNILPLSRADLANKITEKAFRDYAIGAAIMPPKQYLIFEKEKGDLRIMPAYSTSLKIASTKLVNVHLKNREKGLNTIMAVIVLNDMKTGMPLCLMDGTYVTGMRTAAASAISIKYLANKSAATIGIIGAGGQALYQIAAILKVKKFSEISVYDINPQNIDILRRRINKEGIKVKIKEDTPEKTAQKDILVTLTPSRSPVIKGKWIKPGAHICAIGADAQGKQELESEALKNAKIVVDDLEQALHSGEINVPFAKGIIRKKDVYSSLGEIINKTKPGRTSDKEVTVFDSTGLAIQDLYLAGFIYFEAQKEDKLREFKIF